MARKAVQGYPEKSYYDNTRYLGIVATTDPLNEGLFKHMVNFDISDTGQSVKPREGFLTTTIKQNPQVGQNIISISNETIIYKDNTIGEYILYDFNNHTGYIADVSAYNVSNYFLPIEFQIANYDWTHVFETVLIPQLSYVRSYYLSSTLAGTITNFLPMITPIPDTKIEHIYDENGISKTLVKVRLIVGGQSNFDFIIQLRYRKDANSQGAADTLIVDGLPYMFEHPTLVSTDRNLAVSKSIIPNNFQTLYTAPNGSNPRQSGQITTLGSFIYVYDDALNYVNNFIKRTINYNIKPYFELNPAYYELNNDSSATDQWAYRFDVVNTSVENINSDVDTIYTSPWMKYAGNSVKPIEVFNSVTARNDQISLGNNNINLNHYRNARYIIFVVPDKPNAFVSTTSSYISGELRTDYPNYPLPGSAYHNIKTSWTNVLNQIKDVKTLKTVINNITSTLFFVADLKSTSVPNPFNGGFNNLTDAYQVSYTISKTEEDTDETYQSKFITGQELLQLIEENKLDFKTGSLAFRLLPYAANETHTIIERDNTQTYKQQWFFGSIVSNTTEFESNIIFKDQQLYFASGEPGWDAGNNIRVQAGTNVYENKYLNFTVSSGVNSNHKILVTTDNRVFGFGRNNIYQLGLNNTTDQTVPTLITMPNGISTIIGAAIGYSHTYILTTSSLISFGSNASGQLGDGTNTTRQTPYLINLIATIIPPQYLAKSISSGSFYGVLLDTNGNVYTWGINDVGQLGRGNTTTGNTSPLSITSNFTLTTNEKIVYTSSGSDHNLALTNQGRVFSWGSNANGRLGLGDTTLRSSPTLITFTGLLVGEKIVSVSAGYNHSIALTNYGKLYGWGSNSNAQLGASNIGSSILNPTIISTNSFLNTNEKINETIAGYRQTYFTTSENRTFGFGGGLLGIDFTTTNTTTPEIINFSGLQSNEYIVGLNTAYSELAVGQAASSGIYNANLFITNFGKIYVWGNNSYGQIGLSNLVNYADVPTQNNIILNENESFKLFQNKTTWFLILNNQVSNESTTNTATRFFDKRTWTLYQGGANNNFLPYINTFTTTFDLYLVKNNNFYQSQYGFYKYDIITGKYIIETDLNILKSGSKTPVNFTATDFTNNQPPFYSSTNPSGATAPYALNGTKLQVIGVNGTTQGSIYVQQTNGSTYGNTWTPVSAGVSAPGFIFSNGQTYYNTHTQKTYIWNNLTGTTGVLTEIINDLPNLVANNFFDKGLSLVFYMKPYEESELSNKTYTELETLKIAWGVSSFIQSMPIKLYGDDSTVTYIEKQLTLEPEQIQTSNNLTVFENSRLLVWNKNVLYISEEGRFYWFKERNRIEFAEEIVKVLQYKQIILVFTTQHLYAVYRVETSVTQLNPSTNQIEQNVTGVAWLKQIVLYNLLVNKKYSDVIQIFNQMVLFYSEDGQLFMIRPSSQIDDQTRFSIQYFNKAANDILEHYDEYINERLASYGSYTRITKDQVKIKALVSINFIKLIYYVPNVITYMLIYDVLNNRYTAHDSLTFTDVYDKMFVESGELFVTQQNNKLLFTMPYVEVNTRDNHADMTYTNNFKKEGINCLIDTGNLNLNNHLYKRFRDLHVVFKNLNSSNVLFNVETMVDEIIARPFYNTQLEVQESGNKSYFVSVPKANDKDLIELVDVNQISETATSAVREALLQYSLTNNLFENNNILMDFSQYTSSKLLTHRTSILGYGKVFRIKLQFISKGSYKVQHFGIIYKERRI